MISTGREKINFVEKYDDILRHADLKYLDTQAEISKRSPYMNGF
jgi:hypothetical protein